MPQKEKEFLIQPTQEALMLELTAARTQIATAKRRRQRCKLDPYRSAILHLRELGATYDEIRIILARQRIKVSAITVRNSIIRWQTPKIGSAMASSLLNAISKEPEEVNVGSDVSLDEYTLRIQGKDAMDTTETD